MIVQRLLKIDENNKLYILVKQIIICESLCQKKLLKDIIFPLLGI